MRTCRFEAPGRDRFGVAGARLPCFSLTLAGERSAAPVPWALHVDFERRDASGMKLELAQIVSAWPLGVSLAATVAVRGLRSGRRRMALNEALHELRRPLQALALSAPGAEPAAPAIQGSVRSAAIALERLEREINGEPWRPAQVPISARPLLEAAVGRWQVRAAMAGDSLSLRWQAGEAIVAGNRGELSQALDNLIVNAIEHGGPEVVVEVSSRAGRVRVAVIDRGREPGLEVLRRRERTGCSPGSAAAAATAMGCGWSGASRPGTGATFGCAARSARPRPCSSCRWWATAGEPADEPAGTGACLPARGAARRRRGRGDRRRLRGQRGPRLRCPAAGRRRPGGPRRGRRRSGRPRRPRIWSCAGCRHGSCRRTRSGARPRRSAWRRRRRSPPAPTSSPRSCARRAPMPGRPPASEPGATRSRSRSAAPRRCSSPGRGRWANRSTWW